MALVRILIDGYSLLHQWRDLAPGRPRHSAAAREELIARVTQYQDATGVPVTIVFDGANAPPGTPEPHSRPEMEILYSKAGQTADQIIERVSCRLVEFGSVLVVTNDFAERDLVRSFGADTADCESFIGEIEARLEDLQRDIQRYNRRERTRYRDR